MRVFASLLTGVITPLLAFAPSASAQSVWDTLTPVQQAALRRGEQVFATENVAGKPWPKVFVYQMVDAAPEQAAAVFADYESARAYIKELKKSQISLRVSPRVTEVDYILDVPMLADEHYTVRNTLAAYDAAGPAYRVDWTLVRASSTQASTGWARFEAQGAGTLFAYHSFVVPGSGMANLVRERALRQVRDTVRATVNHIQTLRTQRAPELERLVGQLRRALAAD
jgi:hypothetical protein